MRFLEYIKEMLLTEATLTKGSQRVMSDPKLVANLADAMRDDAASHPQNFPPNSKRTFQKTEDAKLAEWFLENLDKIEREGYEGTVYSRDGVYSDWIVRRYIAGSHNWEDITGVMNMNLRDWTLLKNRNMLDPNHRDIPKFNSVRDVGQYMSTHYADKLEKIRDAAKNAARNKMSKSVKLVDNDDYRIYTTLNRAAGCALGLGTQWCTANSQYAGHFHNYSGKAMLFQLFPYAKDVDAEGNPANTKDEEGKNILNDKEKYQFDAGGPNFMTITDHPVRPEVIREKYPYLYSDLSSALKKNKGKMETAFKELAVDPTLQGEDYKIKTYEIDEEIEKLQKFIARGYMTDEVRPSKKAPEAPGEQPTLTPPEQSAEAPPVPPQGNPQMENIDKDIEAMLNNLKKYDILKESVAPVLGMYTLNEKGKKPDFLDFDKDKDKKEPMTKALSDKSNKDDKEDKSNKDDKDDKKGKLPPWLKKDGKEKVDEETDEDDEDDDKEELDEKDLGKHNNGKTTGFKAVAKNAAAEYGSKEKGQKVAGAVLANMRKSGKIEEEVDTGPDPEVISWMKRFERLGRMS